MRLWNRIRLARQLLLEYEREERERIPFPEAMRRLNAYSEGRAVDIVANASLVCDNWQDAVMAKAKDWPA